MINSSEHKLSRVSEILICVFYTWYFLPICNALFWSAPFKLAALGCLLAGAAYCFYLNGLRFNMMLGAVMTYMAAFTFMWALGLGDTNAYIRVSFTFWGTALVYAVLSDEARLRIGKYLIVLFIITYITSSFGVVSNNSAARTLACASADEDLSREFRMMNIASIYLFQCSIFFVPILLLLPQTLKAKLSSYGLLALLFIVLVNAAFTISLIVYCSTLTISFILKDKVKANRFATALVVAAALVAVFFNGYDLLTMAGRAVKSNTVAVRMYELRDMIYLGQTTGDAESRSNLYLSSLKTFDENLFGVGPNYSFVMFDDGIGHHSQLLDDLARYGVFGLAFYVVFFTGYYVNLKKEWAKVGRPQIAFIIVVSYLTFLIFNIGFRSADETVIAFFIIPILPSLILQRAALRDNSQGGVY